MKAIEQLKQAIIHGQMIGCNSNKPQLVRERAVELAGLLQEALASLQAPPETMLEKGQALKQFRLDVLNMGLRRFAEWIGLRPSYLANVEHGRAYWQTPEIDEKGNITTPDKQAPQGEFTKAIRPHIGDTEWEKGDMAAYTLWLEVRLYTLWLEVRLEEACDRLDRLDRQEAENKQLEKKLNDAIDYIVTLRAKITEVNSHRQKPKP